MKQNYVKCNKVGTTLDTPTLETKRYKYNAVENRTLVLQTKKEINYTHT